MITPAALGVVPHDDTSRKTDYLYRVSLKCLVRNGQGKVLVVKEAGRDWWDLPGGGMDHAENIQAAIAREMKEEVNLKGAFSYRIVHVEDPALLDQYNFWQLRLIYEVSPKLMSFSPGDDGDAVAFKNPAEFKNSGLKAERRIYEYAMAAAQLQKTPDSSDASYNLE